MPVPELIAFGPGVKPAEDQFDALVVVGLNAAAYDDAVVEAHRKVDVQFGSTAVLVPTPSVHGGRLVLSQVAPLADYDDVRRFADAARAGVLKAKNAGSVRPFLALVNVPETEGFENALVVSLLGALAGLYEIIQGREGNGEDVVEPVKAIGFSVASEAEVVSVPRLVRAIEEGRRVAKDLCSGDPERMSALKCTEYIVAAFAGSNVTVEVEGDLDVLERDYPLLHAVARASIPVKRHHPTVVRLTLKGEGEIEESVLFGGKGITYDTGGADVKAGGIMAGMHTDKGGASAVAGFFKTASLLPLKGIQLVAELGFVRNSIGSDAYVADEIIKSHAGVRVYVANTDAEGRMVLSDLISHLRVKAIAENLPKPQFFTCATLTGHAARSVGHYPITLDNPIARDRGTSVDLQRVGEVWGDPFEVSRLRKDDFEFIKPKNKAYDVVQCNLAASSVTARGHQFPAAFISIASGVNKQTRASDYPIAYTHLDIAGASSEDGDLLFGRPTGVPIVALTAKYLIPRIAQ